MQDQIIPIDALESFESENDLSAAPLADFVYVFCPNPDSDGNVSSYSAYGMTVSSLIDLYSDFCDWERFNILHDKFSELSGYYYNTLRPVLQSAFPTSEQLTGVYMCRTQRTSADFPYKLFSDEGDDKRDMRDLLPNYKTMSAERGSSMMYHEWADFNTKRSDISSLAWLAPGGELSDSNAIAHDKYLEYRRQFIMSLLQNRKRVIMAKANLQAKSITVSREIRFDNKDYDDKYNDKPDLQLGKEEEID